MSLGEAESKGLLAAILPALRHVSFHLLPSTTGGSAGGARSGAQAILPLFSLLLPGGGVLSKGLETTPGLSRVIAFAYSTLSRLHRVGSCAPNAELQVVRALAL
jgi:hypothetical protein